MCSAVYVYLSSVLLFHDYYTITSQNVECVTVYAKVLKQHLIFNNNDICYFKLKYISNKHSILNNNKLAGNCLYLVRLIGMSVWFQRGSNIDACDKSLSNKMMLAHVAIIMTWFQALLNATGSRNYEITGNLRLLDLNFLGIVYVLQTCRLQIAFQNAWQLSQ